MQFTTNVGKWGVFEASVSGRTEGNPFVDYDIRGTFEGPAERVEVAGFYGGDGTYRVRVIDTWNMTVEERGIHSGNFRVELPGREYMALLLTKVDD